MIRSITSLFKKQNAKKNLNSNDQVAPGVCESETEVATENQTAVVPEIESVLIVDDDTSENSYNEDYNNEPVQQIAQPVQSANECDPALASRNYSSSDKALQPMIKFPKSTKRNLTFQPDWYKQFPWVEYSLSKDAVYCFVCRKFGLERAYSDKCFVINGYSKWIKAKDKFRKHQGTDNHIACFTLFSNRIVLEANKNSIASQMVASHTKEIKSNRYHLGK